jgi:hypothetical protein
MAHPHSELSGPNALPSSVSPVLVRHSRNAAVISNELASESILVPICRGTVDLDSVCKSNRKFHVRQWGKISLNSFKTPRSRNVVLFVWRAALLGTFALAAWFAPLAVAQGVVTQDGSIPVPVDWSSRHVLFTGGFTPKQAEKTKKEPRAYAQWLLHGGGPEGLGLVRRRPMPPTRSRREMGRDWAVSLGGGGVAQGMSPAKYTFDANATPSCTSDYAVFPINTSTGNTRANVIGTFSAEPATGQTAAITITPTGGTAVTLTLTSSATLNTGTNFAVSTVVATNATNLAAAINRNLSNTAHDRVVAIASGSTVSVYALTPGTGVTLTDATTLTTFSWGTVNAGTNGSQANIVAFNQLYSGSGSSLCNLTNPEFIFSYASGVGPVATSPSLSLDGTKITYVENDPNIGAILHVLTFGNGSTEYGTSASCATNNNGGSSLPTCATNPVIPGSTSGSTATDFMLPLGLVAANATTAVAGAADSFSSPFTFYGYDTTYVGDNNGYLYSINPTYNGTPGYAGGNFPVQVSAAPASASPTQVTASTTVVTVTVTNTLGIGELVTIAGVTANTGNGCSTGDLSAINGTQTVASASGTQFTFNATILSATTGTGCTITGATVIAGSNYLSSPVVDVAGTQNIFVGDSSANLYALTPRGTAAAPSISVGENVNGGIRDSPIIDSTNSVGFVTVACNTAAAGEADALNAALIQFKFTSSTLSSVAVAALDTGANQNCTVAGFPVYDPTPDDRYYVLGISSATQANNGEIIGAASGTGGQQIKEFQFASSAMQTTPVAKPQIGTSNSVVSPLTEFYNSQVFIVTGVTATTTVVTVTAANTLAVNDMVTLSGVAANGTACTMADVNVINGGLYTIVSASGTQFTFDATIPSATTGTGCTVAGAAATGGPDYMFMGVNQNPSAVYTFLLPSGVATTTATITATNTTDAVGGVSAIVVDNDSTSGQTSSIYFGTLAKSATVCGTTAAYCAIKLTQAALQ